MVCAKFFIVGCVALLACGEAARADLKKAKSILAEEEEAKTSLPCRRYCKKLDGRLVNRLLAEGGMSAVQAEANLKCSHEELCGGCTGGGPTIADCRPPPAADPPVDDEPTAVPEPQEDEKEEGGGDPAAPRITICQAGGLPLGQKCYLHDGETCTPTTDAWCKQPARNPGHKYRNSNGQPLCCTKDENTIIAETDEGSPKDDIPQALEDAVQELVITPISSHTTADTEEDLNNPDIPAGQPEPPVPICAEGGVFQVETFKRKNKIVDVCRDTNSGQFAKNVCCAEAAKSAAAKAAVQLLEQKAQASAACAEVADKYCKPDIATFEKKRKSKAPNVPANFSCRRMYMCERGQMSIGPVPNPSHCAGFGSAKKFCTEVLKV